jgi:two-component system, NtrC family, sensor kinase
MQPKFINRVSVKLIIIISSILLLNLAVYTYYTVYSLNKDLTNWSTENAFNISDIIRKSTRHSMLLNRREDVYQIINTVGTEKGVEKIRIYNKQGTISFSSDTTELGIGVNLDAEACNVCHSKPTLPSNLAQNEMVRIYKNPEGKKVLGLINPIPNEADCYTADCHAHEESKNILGVLDVVLTTETSDAIVEANIKNIITNAVILMLLISSFVIIFIAVIVNKPISEISKGIDEIAQGNLDYKISLESTDELGIMAKEFNQMSSKLDAAYKEIKEWSETLNQKVQEKNEELKKIYEQITQIEKLASLGKLSATVAHELNNPLEGILTYSKLIARKIEKQDEYPEKQKLISFLNLISDETARCGKIVKDLLLFSRTGEGEYLPHNLRDILDKSLIIINHHFQINKIKLIRNFEDKEFPLVCDGQKIEQALIAVLINAIEAMGEGGTLCISITQEDQWLVIRITDEGKGISEKDLPLIFEPFYSTKGDNKGTGLGLPVAYGIINQHKGKIIVENTSARGTTFKIILPLYKINKNLRHEHKSEYSNS